MHYWRRNSDPVKIWKSLNCATRRSPPDAAHTSKDLANDKKILKFLTVQLAHSAISATSKRSEYTAAAVGGWLMINTLLGIHYNDAMRRHEWMTDFGRESEQRYSAHSSCSQVVKERRIKEALRWSQDNLNSSSSTPWHISSIIHWGGKSNTPRPTSPIWRVYTVKECLITKKLLFNTFHFRNEMQNSHRRSEQH